MIYILRYVHFELFAGSDVSVHVRRGIGFGHEGILPSMFCQWRCKINHVKFFYDFTLTIRGCHSTDDK
jgi:hypothetical protein